MSVLMEKIIAIVKINPILYDVDHEDYNNAKKKEATWNKIGFELSESGESIKTKWKNIKIIYIKHLEAINSGRPESPNKNYKNWHWGPKMEFYKPFVAPEKYLNTACSKSKSPQAVPRVEPRITLLPKPGTSFESEQENPDEQENAVSGTCHNAGCQRRQEYPTIPSRRKSSSVSRQVRNRRGFTKPAKNTSMLPVDTVVEFLNKKEKLSPIEMTFMGYANTVATFSPQRQITIKAKISELIMQMEMLQTAELVLSRNTRSRGNGSSPSS